MNNSLADFFSVHLRAILYHPLSVQCHNFSSSAGSVLYVLWVLLFLNIRKKLDWQYFELLSLDQSYWVETVSAMQDIKIYNYEKTRRWEMGRHTSGLYHVNKRVLAVTTCAKLGEHNLSRVSKIWVLCSSVQPQ